MAEIRTLDTINITAYKIDRFCDVLHILAWLEECGIFDGRGGRIKCTKIMTAGGDSWRGLNF